MAEPTKTRTCPGCNRKTDNAQHCVFPSNPTVNAAHPVKRDPLDLSPTCAQRRARQHAIRLANGQQLG